jgi:hypothetical protein
MATDIHVIAQRRVAGQWQAVPFPQEPNGDDPPGSWDPLTAQDYVLFSVLAGVRGLDVAAIVAPRGLPPDLGLTVDGSGGVVELGTDPGGYAHFWLG